MLENQKKWCHEKVEEGKKWISKNQRSICFSLGIGTMAAFYLIMEKLNSPKQGAICFGRDENDLDRAIGQVWYKDQLGREHHFMNIDYEQGDKSAILKKICDNLNEIVYPGD